MAISPARTAAFDALLRVQTEEAYASELLHADKISRSSERDRNLATQIVMGVLRWQSRLDDGLRPFAAGRNDIAKLDDEVLIALRMAAFQLMFLDRVPVNAAVNDSVELVKRARKSSAAPFVNAVLRKVSAAPKRVEANLDSVEAISQALAHPLWLVERWAKCFGLDATRRICEADQEVPTTSLRMPFDSAEAAAINAELRAAGVELEAGRLMANARRVIRGDVTAAAAFRERRVAIQDEASQLVAALVGQGERILDCCAAPGGKTSAIAAQNPQAEIVAAELHPHRARLLREMVSAKNVEVVAADVTGLQGQPFDRVLADVPCSGTGTLARNPEIKWRLKPEDLRDLHRRQAAILSAAIERATVGGRIVYSTCSLESEENEQVVDEVMQNRKDIRLLDVESVLDEVRQSGAVVWPDLAAITTGNFLRTLPGVHPCDGFFAAVFEKISA